MKMLLVGDPHATSDSLNECRGLVNFIIKTAQQENVDSICILGDLYHNHGVVHLSVQKFWQESFDLISEECPRSGVIALVGNHDKSGDISAPEHALMLHQNVQVIDSPHRCGDILYMPYMADSREFVKACKENPTEIVIAHQEFMGGVWDNGIAIDKDAVDPEEIPQKMVISGHIHTAQRFGKVWYPGSPRWRTIHDANTEKYIYSMDLDAKTLTNVTVMHSTKSVCKPIVVLKDNAEAPAVIPLDSLVTVDIYGTKDYIDIRKKELENQGCRVRTFPVLERKLKVKESDGISKALLKFLNEWVGKVTGVELIKMCQERISWMK
jgi:DNA repair exonuclease SbcCD nuclease subunit